MAVELVYHFDSFDDVLSNQWFLTLNESLIRERNTEVTNMPDFKLSTSATRDFDTRLGEAFWYHFHKPFYFCAHSNQLNLSYSPNL